MWHRSEDGGASPQFRLDEWTWAGPAEHQNLDQSRVKDGETGLSHPGDRLQFVNPRLDGFNVVFLKEIFACFPVWGGRIAAGLQLERLAEPLKYKQELIFFNAPRREISLAYRRPPADK